MRYIIIFLFSLIIFSSCKIFKPSLMLKTPKDFTYDKLVDSLSRLDYRIAKNDLLLFRLYPNDAFKLINLATETNALFKNDIEVVVESTDSVKMPGIGRVKLAGLTIKEAEKFLQERYSKFYVEPFVFIRVANRRVIVFPGSGGLAKVLPIANNNVTIIEAIAAAGGIVDDGKAYKVKLIRNNPDPTQKPFVYLMDLSHVDGIMAGQSIVQAGDIIYVEPRYKPLATFSKEVAPIITLLTAFIIIYQFSKH